MKFRDREKLVFNTIYRVAAIIGLLFLFLSGGCGGSGGGGGGGGGSSSAPTDDTNNPGNVDQSQSKTLILHVSTLFDDIRMSGILSPSKEATIGAVNLEDNNARVMLNISGETVTITPSNVSIEDQSITFTAPANIVEGKLSVVSGNTTTVAVPYRIFTEQTPYISSVEPEVAKPGENITITGSNLPDIPVEVIFEGQGDSLTLTVTPSGNQVSFTVPSSARSGYLHLQIAQITSNKLYLAIKKDIDVQVALPQGINFNASDISFVLGGTEYVLDNNFTARIPIENNNMQYIHTTVDQGNENYPLLYSAVVLPDTTIPVTVNAESTAIAWIFIGIAANVVLEDDALRSFYDTVASNTKVQEFAGYIESLQKQNFTKWANLDDPTLTQMYQDALKDVILNDQASKASLQRAFKSDSLVNITQDTENSNIYLKQKLNSGSVSIINDTKLFLSVEARSKKDNEIINNYEHISNAIDMMNSRSIVGPKGWGLLGIASEKTLDLNGVDSRIEIIIGAYDGDTDKQNIADNLRNRVIIEGVFAPILNQIISTLMDRRIPKGHAYKNIIGAMTNIYGAGFLLQLTTKVSNKNSNWPAILDTLVITPLKAGYNSCFQAPTGGVCEATMKGLAKLIGVQGFDNIVNKLMILVLESAERRIIKTSVALVPVVGWIVRAAFFVNDNIGYVSDTATIAESIYDMKQNPQEINAEVDFKLEIADVQPTCVAIGPSDSTVSFDIKGDGFIAANGTFPYVHIGTDLDSDNDKTDAFNVIVNEEGARMQAIFNSQELIDEGSWADSLFVGHGLGLWMMYDKNIRIIDERDEEVDFDAIVPSRVYAGGTVTLKGCGWIPLHDIRVYFSSGSGYAQGNVLTKTVDTIEVRVPDNAVSGTVYVTAGGKETRKLFFELNPFSLTGADRDILVEGSGIVLEGNGLAEVTKVYFIDHTGTRQEGSITYATVDSIRVTTPSGLKHGEIRIYAQRENGYPSNELTLPMVPKWVEADPPGQAFEESIQITLTQEEDIDIYYRIDDGGEQLYSGPITLNANDAEYEYFTLYAYARVDVEGSSYDSIVNEYQYTPCGENERLEGGVCVVSGGMDSCPMTYDPSLDDNQRFYYYINLQDKDGDGTFEDSVYCGYDRISGQLIFETPFVDSEVHGIKKSYYESGQLLEEVPYVNGLRNGIENDFYGSGQLLRETPWVDNAKNGTQKEYYESGQLKRETSYVDAYRNGEDKYYSESGELLSCRIYEGGFDLEGDNYSYCP